MSSAGMAGSHFPTHVSRNVMSSCRMCVRILMAPVRTHQLQEAPKADADISRLPSLAGIQTASERLLQKGHSPVFKDSALQRCRGSPCCCCSLGRPQAKASSTQKSKAFSTQNNSKRGRDTECNPPPSVSPQLFLLATRAEAGMDLGFPAHEQFSCPQISGQPT